MKTILLALLVFGSVFAHATACTYTGYSNRYQLPIPAQAGLSANVGSFIVYYPGNALLAGTGSGGVSQSSTGLDIEWCDAAGNLLSYELASGTYSTSTGAGEWHIGGVTVSKTVTTYIYAVVGKSGASDLSNASGLWTNYNEVLHMGTSSSLSLTSSTGSNNATNTSGGAATAGDFAGGVNFPAATNYFTLTGGPSGSTSRTIQYWVKTSGTVTAAMYDQGDNSTNAHRFLICFCSGSAGTFVVDDYNGGSHPTSHAIRDGAWHKVVVTSAGSTVTIKVDGNAIESSSWTINPNTAATPQYLSQSIDGATGVVGSFDEFRVQSAVLSADWQMAEWLNESSPSTFFGTLTPALPGGNYYVSTSGSDSNNGTSSSTPWQTISHVNAQVFGNGAALLFHGGDTFTGPLTAMGLCIGTQAAPSSISSYGTGLATITAPNGTSSFSSWAEPYISDGTADGIDLVEPQWCTVSNINITGNGWSGTPPSHTILNFGTGIQFLNTTTGTNCALFNNTVGPNVTISGVAFGVYFNARSASNSCGFNGVNVSYNNISNNLLWAVMAYGYNIYLSGSVANINNMYVGHNTVTNYPGNPSGNSSRPASGSEAFNFGGVNGLTVEKNYVNEGNYVTGSYGAVCSIVAAFGNNIEILGNEVTGTSSFSTSDGCAIDLDYATTNSEVAYNLTYNNVGSAVQQGSLSGQSGTGNNRIHHNISYNDQRGYSSSAMQGVFRFFGYNTVGSTWVYNNTAYFGSGYTASSTPSMVSFELATSNTNIIFANNIFKTNVASLPMFYNLADATTPEFIGNVYDSSGQTLLFSNGGVSTLANWRATGAGYENLNGVTYGSTGAANLANLSGFSAPGTGFISTSSGLPGVLNFNITAGSAAIAAGVDPELVGTFLGWPDYHGVPARTGAGVDIGASAYLQPSQGNGPGPIVIQ